MKIKTQFDKGIVEAAGIDSSKYTDEQITDFATKLIQHPDVHSRVLETLKRSASAQAIIEVLQSNPGKKPSLHNTILKECGQQPLHLK